MIERSFQLFLLMKSYQVVNHTYFLAIAVHIEGETALPALRGLIKKRLIYKGKSRRPLRAGRLAPWPREKSIFLTKTEPFEGLSEVKKSTR